MNPQTTKTIKTTILLLLIILTCTSITYATNYTINPGTSINTTIQNAQNGDTITLNPGTYQENEITIDKSITIQGNGTPETIIIDGQKTKNIFTINLPTVKTTFKNLTITNGTATEFGGAINNNDGTITVINCILTQNSAGFNGGAIANNGTATIINSTFKQNKIRRNGGAINTYGGTLKVINSYFQNNTASRDGGAIAIAGLAKATITNSTFTKNYAKDWGGAIYNWMSTTTITQSTLQNNTASIWGGAILTYGNITITQTQFTKNYARDKGGAIYSLQEYSYMQNIINANYNAFINNTAYTANDIYLDQLTNTINFNNNWWGTNNPLNTIKYPQTWNERYVDSKNASGNPTSFLKLYINTKYTQLKNNKYLITVTTGLEPKTNLPLSLKIEINNQNYTRQVNGITIIQYTTKTLTNTISTELDYEKITKNITLTPKTPNNMEKDNASQISTSSNIPMQNTGLPVSLLILGLFAMLVPSIRRK